ncbi:MAG TPA: penicillin-binding protein 1C [Bryobacteraceae bacterium]|nr:penicillin-binding protein 1C [Bryobacteraceae bacterium]
MKRLIVAALVVLLVVRFYPHAPLSERVRVSTSLWSADGQLLRVTLASDDNYRLWTPLSQISARLVDAFLLKEDRRFYWHPGVNPVALARAAFLTWRGAGHQGGSTITMQVARRLYGLKTRTPSGKLKQAAAALWLEARYSKREILEAYLNVVPFGGNIEGVGAASRIYFGKPAAEISLGEALTLAVIPQRPAARAGRGAQDAELLKARARLGAMWLRRGKASDVDRRQIGLDIVARQQYSLPHLAPHFTDTLLASTAGHPARIDTTLDASMQAIVERQVNRYISETGERGIRNASVLVADPRDMSTKAWIGSADFHDESIDGQVNGVLAKRSPGSTLKPFIYALALDQGVLHPRTMLRDAPTSFGPFTPENFDGRFLGPIAAEDALIRSRNVPAMWVAAQLHEPSLYQFLKLAGISRMDSEDHYGLALVLGGGEVTMMELAGLYAMLPNDGVLRPFRTQRTQKPSEGVRLLSPEAAFITMEMLRRNPRVDEDGTISVRTRWPVAWKTGTSWAFRDAWTAGIAGPYVVVVWIGNFDGQGNPGFIGADAAAPLFFRIVDALNLARAAEPVPPLVAPKGVKRVAVCALSGDLPNAWCPQTIDTWYIPGKSPIRVSQLHRAVPVDAVTNRPVCAASATGPTRTKVFEFWPSDTLRMFRKAGMPRRQPPVLPDCATDDEQDGPRIESPLRDVSYALRNSARSESIALEAAAAGDVANVFWFDGGEFLGKRAIADGAMPWRPTAEGIHLVRVIDDHGRMAERDVDVQIR